MEYHWYEDYWAMPRNLPRGHEFFIGYYQTQRAIHHHVAWKAIIASQSSSLVMLTSVILS